jgi:hypothetical protein
MSQPIDPNVLLYFRNKLRECKYEEISFLELKKQEELLPSEMVRLDQLPAFQDVFFQLPAEVQELRTGNNMNKAFFLFHYALYPQWKLL